MVRRSPAASFESGGTVVWSSSFYTVGSDRSRRDMGSNIGGEQEARLVLRGRSETCAEGVGNTLLGGKPASNACRVYRPSGSNPTEYRVGDGGNHRCCPTSRRTRVRGRWLCSCMASNTRGLAVRGFSMVGLPSTSSAARTTARECPDRKAEDPHRTD